MESYNNSDQKFVIPLFRLFRSGASNEKIYEWYNLRGNKYSNSLIKLTCKMASREDIIPFLIEEEDIELNDFVKSKMTSRTGVVVKIHSDGDTISVKWDTGGIQPLSKESVYKYPKSGDVSYPNDLKKVHTQGDEYKGMDDIEPYGDSNTKIYE